MSASLLTDSQRELALLMSAPPTPHAEATALNAVLERARRERQAKLREQRA